MNANTSKIEYLTRTVFSARLALEILVAGVATLAISAVIVFI